MFCSPKLIRRLKKIFYFISDTLKRSRTIVVAREGHGTTCRGSSTDNSDCSKGCCPRKFHCSRRKKCVPQSYRCDYDNDCGDSQDEDGCSESCVTKYTGWNRQWHGQVKYLDRHRLNCGNKVMKGFQLEHDGGRWIRYKYKCCSLKRSICKKQGEKALSYVKAKGDNALYLDRQFVDCGKHAYLVGFRLGYVHSVSWRAWTYDKYRYLYTCCKLTATKHRRRTRCVQRNTASTYIGGKVYNFKRLHVSCPGREFLSNFKLARSGNYAYYKYSCCRVRP